MLPEIKYMPVNWVDGMKITKDHFMDTENAFYDRLRDANCHSLTNYSYGLLSPVSGSKSSLDVKISIDRTNRLRVTVLECRGITPGGGRIEILRTMSQTKSHAKEIHAEYDLSKIEKNPAQTLFIVISVNPFSRIAAGTPDPDANPPRFPYAQPEYQLNLLTKEEIKTENGIFHLCIGKLRVTGSSFELIENYIPPCSAVENHPDTVQTFEELSRFMVNMEKYTSEIIQKIYSKNQQNELAGSVLYLSEHIMSFLNSNILLFKWTYRERSPLFMVELFARFAKLIKNTVDIKSGAGTEQLLNYFKDWIVEVNQGEFESTLIDMMNVQYDHMDIDASIEKLQAFTRMMADVFKKLSKLDYIGEKKKADIIVTTRAADEAPATKKRSFLLD